MVVDPVIAAMEEQVGLYRRLAKLAEVQHDHVQQGKTEELLRVLEMRQEVLGDLGKLEQTVGPARREWAGYLAGLDESERGTAQQLMDQAQRLLEEITTADRHDALLMQQRKLNLGKQISQARAARKVNHNYATAAYGRTRASFDVTGT